MFLRHTFRAILSTYIAVLPFFLFTVLSGCGTPRGLCDTVLAILCTFSLVEFGSSDKCETIHVYKT